MTDTWYTKEDVVRDLALVTGSNVCDYDDCYFVRGERPPPPVLIDDDAEKELQNLQFYGGADGNTRNNDENTEPDLEGISLMIQMVKEYDDDATSTPTEELQETIVVISKLNPNVKEFVPKSSVSTTSNEKNSTVAKDKDNHCDSNNTINPVSTENMDAILKGSTKITSSSIFNGKNELDREHLFDAQLKNKIKNASVSKTLKNKREKNVAIAALLKLHTRPTNASPQTIVSTPPLLPPQYFEKCYFNSSNTNDVKKSKETNGMSIPLPIKLEHEIMKSKSSVFNSSNIESKIEKEHSNSENELRAVTRDAVQSINKEKCCLNEEIEVKEDKKAVEESINKVKRWLDKPNSPKLKPPVLQAGQVTYLKKSKAMSPNPDAPEDIRSTSSSVASHYVPSQYADDLCKKYMKQSKDRDDRRDDMWTKLERELKERDERITKSKQSSTNASSNNRNDDNN